MLQTVLDLFRAADGATFSKAAIAARLDLAPEIVEQMLYTLVQKGRLRAVGPGCNDCDPCPLRRICSGGPDVSPSGYVLADHTSRHSEEPVLVPAT